MDEKRINCYEPVWRADARILILGTAPSVESLRQGFYYAHPRNAFWPIMADVFGADPPRDIDDKRRLLIKHRIALWDVAASCARPGSMDAAIRDVVPSDVPGLIQRLPGLTRILLNGGTAHALYVRFFGKEIDRPAIRLPSTSPAYTMPYDQKRALWADALTEGTDP